MLYLLPRKRFCVAANIAVISMMVIVYSLAKLFNVVYIDFNIFASTLQTTDGNSISVISLQKGPISKTIRTTRPPTDVKIPWRFNAEEDGFIFPAARLILTEEKYITYDPVNRTIEKQILQFENAVVFANLLQRTLIVPPLIISGDNGDVFRMAMSDIVNFALLSRVVKVLEMTSDHNASFFQGKSVYSVCQDPFLGFWLDYIPSTENIHAWRLLKQQYFSPAKVKFLDHEDTNYGCPGTEKYFDRWGPPLRVKPLYRGILTELNHRKEQIISFRKSTLDTLQTRFFDKKRVKLAQEILLFYIRFSKPIILNAKMLAKLLGYGYTAIVAGRLGRESKESIGQYVQRELSKLKTKSKTIFVVLRLTDRSVFQPLREMGFNVVFDDVFFDSYLKNLHDEPWYRRTVERHVISLMLCANADHFIGFPGASGLYFIEHLRIQDGQLSDGLVNGKINIRWIKHTVKNKTDDRKVFFRAKPEQNKKHNTTNLINVTDSTPAFITPLISEENKVETIAVGMGPQMDTELRRKKREKSLFKLRANTLACTFCNYIKYVTGNHSCTNTILSC